MQVGFYNLDKCPPIMDIDFESYVENFFKAPANCIVLKSPHRYDLSIDKNDMPYDSIGESYEY